MSAVAPSSARIAGSAIAGLEANGAPSLGELAQLARASAAQALPDTSAELLRLGAGTPEAPPAVVEHAWPEALGAATLEDVARIGAHLGPLERAERTLSGEARVAVGERLARVRTLVDCARALGDLRASVLGSLRTARAA